MTASTESALRASDKRRVAAEVALALLEAIQQQDHPEEVFRDENVSETMPRRLGLSDVINTQVRLHRENARKRQKLTDSELDELMRLVTKRPDAPEIFFEVGARLANDLTGGAFRVLPGAVRTFVVKRRVSARLKRLFGRRLVRFVSGPFNLEGVAGPFAHVDPTGQACQVIAGFCQTALSDALSQETLVVEQACKARGDAACRWSSV
ncbi:MAG: hypothetical protein ACR2QM_20490 [Longimicrobiales bacterium]